MTYQTSRYIDFLPKKTTLFQRVSDSLILPRLIQLSRNLYALAFSSMKLLPAKHIIAEAIKRGEIKENWTVVDTSSGTFALGIGIVCAELGLPFQIFGDPAIDDDLLRKLTDLGGQVHISKNPKSPGAYQEMRLQALQHYISQNQLSFWARQYDNLDNQKSYAIVGELLLDALGAHLNIVGAVGSGGSTCGIIKTVRVANASTRLIGVDTFNSILFGLSDGKRILRGLGNSIMPKNLDHRCYDEVHWVQANDAFYHTRQLFKKHAFFCGPTTGAAYQVANYLAEKNKDEVYVFISPDDGSRYLSTVYDDVWLHSQDFYRKDITRMPKRFSHPSAVEGPWACYAWDRQTLQKVMGKNFG